MAKDAENRWNKDDTATGMTEFGVGTELEIPTSMKAAAKAAALVSFNNFQAWMSTNLAPGTMKTWHTVNAPDWYKQGIWHAVRGD